MICYAYCRFSSEGQRDGYSIEAQTRAITEWAERERHIIKKFYVDEAKSGTTDDREQFQQMISDAASDSSVQLVVVHKLDRFARDRYASAVYRHKLKEHGIRVVSVLEPLDDSPESIMMEAVLEGMAEYYSRNLAREVRKGQKEAAMKAQHVGGTVPYGYTLDADRHYIAVPEEAAIIREIFHKLDGGFSVAEVARWTQSHGYTNRAGTLMDEYFITRISQNTMFIGRYTYGKKSREPIVVEGAVEPIVDPAVFWRVCERAQARKNGPRPRNKETEYILTGYLFCEYCGSHLFGFKSSKPYKLKSGEVRDYVRYQYRCAKKAPSVKTTKRLDPDYTSSHCSLKSVDKDKFEDFIFDVLHHVLFSGATFDWLAAEVKLFLQKIPVEKKKIEECKKELEKVRLQQSRLLDLYISDGIDRAAYEAKRAELKQHEELFETELSRLTPCDSASYSLEKIKRQLQSFVAGPNADSPEYKKQLLATYVDHITLSNERVVIYFKFRVPGLGDSHEEDLKAFSVRNNSSVKTALRFRTELPRSAIETRDFSLLKMEFDW